jgi:hypothetical protein
MHVTNRQANSLASERDIIRHHLGTLLSQESHSRTPPRPRRIRQQQSPTEEDLACKFCQSLSHITTGAQQHHIWSMIKQKHLQGLYNLMRVSLCQPLGWRFIKQLYITLLSQVSFNIFGSCTTIGPNAVISSGPSKIFWISLPRNCHLRTRRCRLDFHGANHLNTGITQGTSTSSTTRSPN